MKRWLWIVSVTLLLLLPLSVGYFTAPCDRFGEPLILSPYRLRQQRFLREVEVWSREVAEAGAVINELLQGPQPQSSGETFRMAEQVGQAVARLDALPPPEASEAYLLLGQEMGRAHDTYIYAAESLLTFYGSNNPEALAEARAALEDAELLISDLEEGIAGLSHPRCYEVWRER
jgi:hypothetical protein